MELDRRPPWRPIGSANEYSTILGLLILCIKIAVTIVSIVMVSEGVIGPLPLPLTHC